MHERAALLSREYRGIDLLSVLFLAHDDTAAGTAECLMCSCCNEISVRNRIRVKSCSNKACNVCHIYEEISADFISDLSELLEIDDPRICGSACNDDLRLNFESSLTDSLIVEHLCLGIYLIELGFICSAGDIELHAVCEVSAV